jgi:hypothetical protein
MKWTGLIILFGLLVVSCANSDFFQQLFPSSETGPRFVNLQASKQQRVKQELEANWSNYIILYIPRRAAIFDPADDGNTLLVDRSWHRYKDDKRPWLQILDENTQTTESFMASFLNPVTGFQEIIGPDEQFFGYLVHKKMDMVALEIVDRNTMRIFYSPERDDIP